MTTTSESVACPGSSLVSTLQFLLESLLHLASTSAKVQERQSRIRILRERAVKMSTPKMSIAAAALSSLVLVLLLASSGAHAAKVSFRFRFFGAAKKALETFRSQIVEIEQDKSSGSPATERENKKVHMPTLNCQVASLLSTSTSFFFASLSFTLFFLSCLSSIPPPPHKKKQQHQKQILAIPLPGADSHLFVVTALTEELVKRGHEVLLAVSESDAETLARAPAKRPFTQLTTYKAAYTKKEMKERVENSRQAVSNPFLGALESLVVYFQALIQYCDTEMGDARHLDAMVAFRPDLVIGDVISPCGCGLAFKLPMLVAERNLTPPASWLRAEAARDLRESRAAPALLTAKEGKKTDLPISIPRIAVAVLPMLDPLLPNIQENLPNHLGMIPQVGTGFPAARADAIDSDSDDDGSSLRNNLLRFLGLRGATNRGLMPLWQRCVNVAFYLGAHAIHELRVKPLYVSLGARHGVKVNKEFLHSAAFVVFNSDFAVEAPRPLPPNALFAGSIMSRPAKPLPRDPWDELLGKRKGEVRRFFFFFF